RGQQPGRIRAGREEIPPAPCARPDADGPGHDGQQHPAPAGGPELHGQLVDVDGPEQIRDEGNADGDASEQPELFQGSVRNSAPRLTWRPRPGSWWSAR